MCIRTNGGRGDASCPGEKRSWNQMPGRPPGIQDLWLSYRDMLRSLTGSDQLNAKIETTRLDIY